MRLNLRFAFTLAEVLITLGIIGVVAAITLPALITKYQEKATVTALKKDYSILSQAFTNIVANEGSPDTWDLESAEDFRDLFAKYLKNVKKCDANSGNCQPEKTYYLHKAADFFISYNNVDNHSSLTLNNGTILTFYLHPDRYDKTCSKEVFGIENGCYLTIHIDTNGLKLPNTWGKDRFQLTIYKNRIVSVGDTKMSSPHTFDEDCKTGTGESCAAWVIYNGNMDYLHCDDLSWEGKTSCK